jgi:hypothetical protein
MSLINCKYLQEWGVNIRHDPELDAYIIDANSYLQLEKLIRPFYKFEVLPENQCRGLQMWAKEQGHNRFEGFVRYDKRKGKKHFYLTTDDITYVEVSKVFNVKPVDSENW